MAEPSDSTMLSIVDYGIGNVGSIANMLKRIGVRSQIARTAEDVLDAGALILPGVGAFDRAMNSIQERSLLVPLTNAALHRRIPVLGLCLGMQLMGHGSEEGRAPGLGWIDATTVRFQADRAAGPIKVPHMGWNHLIVRSAHPLFDGLTDESRFYFVHSYHLDHVAAPDLGGVAFHGYEFPAAVARENIMGVQFHPEKSHRFGMKILENFSRIAAEQAV